MVLTRIWAVILAVLAVGCLAGMFLLSSGKNADFSDADRSALRAITEAGVTALEAELAVAPVNHAADIVVDPELMTALSRDDDAVPQGERSLGAIVAELAERVRLQHESNMTVAVIDENGAPKAINGVAEALVPELTGTAAFQEIPSDQSRVFSITLESEAPGATSPSRMYVVFVSAAGAHGHRIVAVEPLNTGADSRLRRVLGTGNPASLVRRGELIGEIIGDTAVTKEMQQLAHDHRGEAPDSGASKVFTIGEEMNARIGAIARVPGPAGRGDNGVMLAVLSGHTAAAGRQDLAEALAQARERRGLSQASWVLLIGLFVVSAALAIYLPWLEGLGPMQRLTRELQAVAQGSQHSIFHDRYGGAAGDLARAAAAAHESLRQAYLAELEIEEEEDADSEGARARPRTTRGRRAVTRSQRKADTGRRSRVNKQVASESAETHERPAVGSQPGVSLPRAPRQPTPPASPAAPPMGGVRAPASALAAPIAPPRPPAPAPAAAPGWAAAPSPGSPTPSQIPTGPALATPQPDEGVDPREAYFREVYDEFLQVKIACGEPTNNFSYDKFAKKLAKNTSDIMDKRPDVEDVRFTVYVKDGKAALKAKVVKSGNV